MATCRQCGQHIPFLQTATFTRLCPHCRAAASPASLGCGTLIMIAIIIAIFSQAGKDELSSEINELKSLIQELDNTIQSQSTQIEELNTKIERLNRDPKDSSE